MNFTRASQKQKEGVMIMVREGKTKEKKGKELSWRWFQEMLRSDDVNGVKCIKLRTHFLN